MFTAQIWTLLPFPEYPSSARHPFSEVVPVELPVPELLGQLREEKRVLGGNKGGENKKQEQTEIARVVRKRRG